MCRKLETEEEKVLPFYASSLTEEEKSDVNAVVQEPPTQPLAEVRQLLHFYTSIPYLSRKMLKSSRNIFFNLLWYSFV